MEQLIVISAVGGESATVVNELARVILDCGGNIKESRMAALGSEFGDSAARLRKLAHDQPPRARLGALR